MKNILIGIAIFIGIGLLSAVLYTCNQAKENVTDNAFVDYQEFQSMYNTCIQINDNMCALEKMDEKDPSFVQFSKASQLNSYRQKMNRWIQDYNAKSKMWNKAMWKSPKLPYELTNKEFSCY